MGDADLDGAVSNSARLVAAVRFLESEEGREALYSDPLAGVLAGDKIIQQFLAFDNRPAGSDDAASSMVTSLLTPEQQAEFGRKRKVTRVCIRTWWVDRCIKDALSGAFDGVAAAARPRQVVLLGAGMDTRPWRDLDYPAGVRWWEIDRRDVTMAKDRALKEAGAQVTADRDEGSGPDALHPLRVAGRRTLQADLSDAGWTSQLEAAGWRRSEATVWLAEGLLMYLEEAAVAALLEETAGASAPGSVLIAMSIDTGYAASTGYKLQGPFAGLENHFRWMCSGADVGPFVDAHGWKMHVQTSYSKMADDAGLHPDLRGADIATGSPANKQAVFFVAVRQ